MLGVIGWPFVDTLRLSYTDARLVGTGGDYVGFANYDRLFASRACWRAFVVTTEFAVVSVFIEMVLGVLVALLLYQSFRGRNVLRALLILPWALPTVVRPPVAAHLQPRIWRPERRAGEDRAA